MPERNDGARAGVLLDLDGTLVDTNYLHALAWVRALRACGVPVTSNAVHRLVGMGGDQLTEELVGRDVPGASEARAARYAELVGECVALPGANDLLEVLDRLGVARVLATSAPDDEIDAATAPLGGRASFDTIVGADDVEASKPHPDVFLAAIRAGGLDAGRTVAVGDSVWDVRAARAAGIGCIGVETGGFSSHELREEGALVVYRDVAELAAQIRTSPVAHLLS